MKRWTIGAGVAVVALGLGAVAFHHLRGPTGASVAYGGAVDAAALADFPSADAASWVNGAPTTLTSLRGSPVLLEFWSPT